MMRLFIFLFLSLSCAVNSTCQSQRIVSFAQSFTINPHTAGKVECSLPESLTGRQSALLLQYNRAPDDTLRKDGGLVAVWKIARSQEPQQIVVLSTLKLTENSLRKASPNVLERQQREDVSIYLEPEKTIQSNDAKIAEIAANLRGSDDKESARNVFNFVKDHLEYNQFYNQRQGAKKALKKGKGDCTEYSELMIAFLRNLGIPARMAMGVTLMESEEDRVGYHNWVEVHFDDLGWISFDPTWADAERAFTTFERMENRYILLGYGHAASSYGVRMSGGDYRVEHKANWEDPVAPIRLRIHLALYSDSISQAHKSIDTLLSWSPEEARYISLRAEAFMREGDFETALPLIQLSFVKAEHFMDEDQSKLNMAAYMANTGKKKEAMELLIALEKEREFNAVTVSYNPLFSPLSDQEDFQLLKARGEALNQKMAKEFEAREAAVGRKN